MGEGFERDRIELPNVHLFLQDPVVLVPNVSANQIKILVFNDEFSFDVPGKIHCPEKRHM